jgi:hypothetical protein
MDIGKPVREIVVEPVESPTPAEKTPESVPGRVTGA